LCAGEDEPMQRRLFPPSLMIGMIFLAILACDLPGAASDPAAQFYPSHTAAVQTLEAMMTGNALSATAAQLTVLPPVATDGMPQASASPPVTEAPAPTWTPVPSGTRLTKLSDGSILYSDFEGGYEIVFPATWMAMRPYQTEYYQAWTTEQAANPDFSAALTRMQGFSTNLTRIFAFDRDLGHIQSGFVSNILITWEPNDNMSLSQELKLITDNYKKTKGVKIVVSSIGETALKLPIAFVEFTETGKTVKGADITTYQKVVIFRVNKGAAAASLGIPKNLREPLLTSFDQMLNTITIVIP
jgi:hypothetical protein